MDNKIKMDIPNLTHSMDFAMQKAIQNGLINDETWDQGLIEIYEALANDFAYAEPHRLMAFLDNHDMDRAFSQYKENSELLSMALTTLLILPRVPQIYYGTEILMENTTNPMTTDEFEAISLEAGVAMSSMRFQVKDLPKHKSTFEIN